MAPIVATSGPTSTSAVPVGRARRAEEAEQAVDIGVDHLWTLHLALGQLVDPDLESVEASLVPCVPGAMPKQNRDRPLPVSH